MPPLCCVIHVQVVIITGSNQEVMHSMEIDTVHLFSALLRHHTTRFCYSKDRRCSKVQVVLQQMLSAGSVTADAFRRA